MKGLFLSIALVLSTSTNANVLVDVGSWLNGAGQSVGEAFKDSENWVADAAVNSETWVVNAAEDTWEELVQLSARRWFVNLYMSIPTCPIMTNQRGKKFNGQFLCLHP